MCPYAPKLPDPGARTLSRRTTLSSCPDPFYLSWRAATAVGNAACIVSVRLTNVNEPPTFTATQFTVREEHADRRADHHRDRPRRRLRAHVHDREALPLHVAGLRLGRSTLRACGPPRAHKPQGVRASAGAQSIGRCAGASAWCNIYHGVCDVIAVAAVGKL